jgi:hypothetical protein
MSPQNEQGGTNARPLNDTVAGTGPGIPDDTGAPGQELPEMPDDEEVRRIARKLGASPGRKGPAP